MRRLCCFSASAENDDVMSVSSWDAEASSSASSREAESESSRSSVRVSRSSVPRSVGVGELGCVCSMNFMNVDFASFSFCVCSSIKDRIRGDRIAESCFSMLRNAFWTDLMFPLEFTKMDSNSQFSSARDFEAL